MGGKRSPAEMVEKTPRKRDLCRSEGHEGSDRVSRTVPQALVISLKGPYFFRLRRYIA